MRAPRSLTITSWIWRLLAPAVAGLCVFAAVQIFLELSGENSGVVHFEAMLGSFVGLVGVVNVLGFAGAIFVLKGVNWARRALSFCALVDAAVMGSAAGLGYWVSLISAVAILATVDVMQSTEVRRYCSRRPTG